MFRRSGVPLLIVAASALLLAGCASAAAGGTAGAKTPTAGGTSAPTSSATPSSATTPTVNPTDALNAMTVLPGDFPPSVPLIEGDILTASSTSSGWMVWIKAADPIAAYRDAASALQDAGFTATTDQSVNGNAAGVFTNDQFAVTLSAGSDAKYPNAVGYQVDRT